MKIYNTLTKKLETFTPIKEDSVSLYACGVTPYKPPHLGHALQGVFFDVFRRYFEYKGYDVTYVRNYTDIDDKIIREAQTCGLDPLELSEKMILEADTAFGALRIQKANFEPKVSEHIDGIISFIQDLLNKEYAYITDKGNIYYKVRKFTEYGKLSNQNVDQMEHGVRKDVETDKEDPLDFALWKSANDKEEIYWTSPWGNGRPGWHIECSVMSSHYLGDHFDIHGGGLDLVFPHHENEIAQSEAVHAGKFANYWMHNGLLMVGTDKMSKSLGNDISLSIWLEHYHPEVIRYLFLSNHYRSNVQFDEKRYIDANKNVYSFYKTLERLEEALDTDYPVDEKLKASYISQFEGSMDQDFNTVEVIALLHNISKEINKEISTSSKDNLSTYRNVIQIIGNVIGLFDLNPIGTLREITTLELKKRNLKEAQIEDLIKKRDLFRKKKEYKEADKCTEELNLLGIKLIDSLEGTTWEFSFN